MIFVIRVIAATGLQVELGEGVGEGVALAVGEGAIMGEELGDADGVTESVGGADIGEPEGVGAVIDVLPLVPVGEVPKFTEVHPDRVSTPNHSPINVDRFARAIHFPFKMCFPTQDMNEQSEGHGQGCEGLER